MATVNSWGSSLPAQVAVGGQGNATLTSNGVLLGNGTGAIVASTAGTTGQVLTGVTGSAPTFQTPAGGAPGMVLLNTQTASNSASIVFDTTYITSTYTNYYVAITGWRPSASGNYPKMDWSVDNGATYITTSYTTGAYYALIGAVPTVATGAVSNHCQLIPEGSLTDSATIPFTGQLWLYGLVNTTTNSYNGTFTYYSGSFQLTSTCCGQNYGANTVNTIKFSMSSGNISSGTISLYGIAK